MAVRVEVPPGRRRSHRVDALIAVAMFGIVVAGVVQGQYVKQRNRHYSRAEDSFNSQDYRAAVAEFTAALRHDPKCAPAYANRAAAYYNLGEIQQSIDDFSRAIEIDPRLAAAYWRRGAAHAKNGDLARARRDQNKARELNPSLKN